MSGQRSFVYSRQHACNLRRARWRIESLERAAQRYKQRLAAARFRDRALESLSDEELGSLVEWLRAVCGEDSGAEPALQGWLAYQQALARETARGDGNGDAWVKGGPLAQPSPPGGAHA
jgi:hypothetical protein